MADLFDHSVISLDSQLHYPVVADGNHFLSNSDYHSNYPFVAVMPLFFSKKLEKNLPAF